jgi:hypothetical protein
MRRLIPVLLSLVLALSLGGQGAARLAATGSTIVLCTGDGAVTVTLGPGGAPVSGHPHCPDCLPLAAINAPSAATPAPPARRAIRIAHAAGHGSISPPPPRHPPARAPPLVPVA